MLGLANIEAMDGYVLTDRLTPRQFAELTDLDVEAARLLYTAYAVNEESYGRVVSGLDSYGVPLMDMFFFAYDQMWEGYVTLDEEMTETLEDLHAQLTDARLQLKGENYSRLVLQLNLPEESPETFAFLDTLHRAAARYYDEYLVAGNSTSDFDLSSSFEKDNIMIGVLSTTPSIASIGVCLGRGTLISIFLVMGILPQILLLGDVIIEKTAFTLKAHLPIQSHTGVMRLDGHVRGYVSGMVDADFTGLLHGTINAAVESGAVQEALPSGGKEEV